MKNLLRSLDAIYPFGLILIACLLAYQRHHADTTLLLCAATIVFCAGMERLAGQWTAFLVWRWDRYLAKRKATNLQAAGDTPATEDSIQSQILDLAVAALPGAERCRFRDYKADELPGRNVLPEAEDAEYDNTDDVTRAFRFTVRHIVAAVDGVDKLADRQYVQTYRELAANAPFRASVRNLREVKKQWERERGELQLMALSVTFEVTFSTSPGDPGVAGY